MTVRKAYLDMSEGQLHYRFIDGPGEIPVVFFHQTASSSAMFEQLMVRLQGKLVMAESVQP